MNADFNRSLFLITKNTPPLNTAEISSRVNDLLLAGDGAISHIIIREQHEDAQAPDDEIIELAKTLNPLAKKHNAKLLINRRPDIALAVDADGVHLGKNSISIKSARELLGPSTIIGFSAHSIEEALEAESNGADYVALSPIYSPLSKETKRASVGLETISNLRTLINIPIVALGGIEPGNTQSTIQAGASAVAGIGSLYLSNEPVKTVKEFVKALKSP